MTAALQLLSLSFLLTVRSCLDSGPDDPITQPTNRGNKLHTNSNFVREGALGYIHPEELYKQVISTPAAIESSLFLGALVDQSDDDKEKSLTARGTYHSLEH